MPWNGISGTSKPNPNVTWEELTQALCVRFGPSDYEDFDEALAKLRQTGTVREYKMQFERLAAWVHNWLETALLGSYIGGLKEEIRSKVKLFRPTTLLHATSLARLQEDKLQKLRRPLLKTALLPTPPPKSGPTNTSMPRLPPGTDFKRLTQSEMQARRDKGLCYNCDERFAPGHRCKKQQVFLLETLTEPKEEEGSVVEIKEDDEPTCPEISLHALSGIAIPHTMRVTGLIDGTRLHILIDSRSTHNFVNSRVAKKPRCRPVTASAFEVLVANGERLWCDEIFLAVPLEIQGYRFETSMYPLQLQGSDAVLGMQWLRSLGRVIHDWEKLTMEFTVAGQDYVIRGETAKKISYGSMQYYRRCGLMR